MTDIRSQLPECPLAYEVPFIPVNHTALVIRICAADIHWQEKMLPWTLASLINNTDIVMEGVHLYIACEDGTQDRIKNAISNFDFPPDLDPILNKNDRSLLTASDLYGIHVDGKHKAPYSTFVLFNVNFWAFRDESNTHKLPGEHILKAVVEPYPDISKTPPDPQLYDMRACTIEQFRHAIKHLMGAQLAMKI